MNENQLQFRFPMARKSDPVTSKEAAEVHQIKVSKRRRQVLDLVKSHPGYTSGELSRIMVTTHLLPLRAAVEAPHKRLPELVKLGLVRMGAKRKCRESGHNAITWYSTPAGDRA